MTAAVEFRHKTYLVDQRDQSKELDFVWFIAKQQPDNCYMYEIARRLAVLWYNKRITGCGYAQSTEEKIQEAASRLLG